jgi:hypothetical protein
MEKLDTQIRSEIVKLGGNLHLTALLDGLNGNFGRKFEILIAKYIGLCISKNFHAHSRGI